MRELPVFSPYAHIKVVSAGGAGLKIIERLIEADVSGVDFLALDTDQCSLMQSRSPLRLTIGERLTLGLGAGGDPVVGQRAAEDAVARITETLSGADMVIVVTGLGGGTGSGAAPVIARVAKGIGAVTIAAVTMPFGLEGERRSRSAQEAVATLRRTADSVIVVDNDCFTRRQAGGRIGDWLACSDDVLQLGLRAITDALTIAGPICVDFYDVSLVMRAGVQARLAIGRATGPGRAVHAAEEAMTSPLLVGNSVAAARGILLEVTAGRDMQLQEILDAADPVIRTAGPDAHIVLSAMFADDMRDDLRVTMIATGLPE